MNGLRGKTAIVTGGSSGIGQAIAVRLGQEGVNVAVNYVGAVEGAEQTRAAIERGERGIERCMEQVADAGAKALLVEADVSSEHEVEGMFKQVHDELGPVDLLVNNAGIQISAPSEVLDAAAFDKVLAVNLRGSFLCAQRAIRQLIGEQRPGAILNVSSVHQLIPKPSFLGYSVGEWRDTDGDGKFDTLEVQTRNMKGPRSFDASGIPLHPDNQTVVTERIYLDKNNKDLLRNEVTTIDGALARPWTVIKTYRRDANAKTIWFEYVCAENNHHVVLGRENYFVSSDGYLMPARKGQAKPDLKYFDLPAR